MSTRRLLRRQSGRPEHEFDIIRRRDQRGSEDGTIIRSEEQVEGARITLEQDACTVPFSITCGIYGWMFHTCFLGKREDAEAEYEQMQEELSDILNLIPRAGDPDAESKIDPVFGEIRKFVKQH